MVHLTIHLFMFLTYCYTTRALTAYDCRSPSTNYTVVSLLDVGECHLPESNYSEEKTRVQVLQERSYAYVQVYECSLVVQRLITDCGMFSHSSMISNGLLTYVHYLGRDACLEIHKTRTFRNFYGHVLNEVLPNSTSRFSIELAGSLSSNGRCNGAKFVENGITYHSVTVQADIALHVRDYTATVQTDTDRIHLRSGLTCKITELACTDSDNGETFWNLHSDYNKCRKGEFVRLYDGTAAIVKPTDTVNGDQTKFIVVDQGNVVFALTIGRSIRACGRNMHATEHPRLLIMFRHENGDYDDQEVDALSLNSHEVDLTAYTNSKLLYVEQGYKRALDSFQSYTIYRRCLLHRQILKNRLAMAPLSPNAIGSLLKNRPGILGVALGESLYLFECLPRKVKIHRHPERRCFKELPVDADGEMLYMAPGTRILQTIGEEIACSNLAPALYFIDNQWIGLSPEPITGINPEIIEAAPEPKFQFKSIQRISADGVYTRQELENARHLMFHNMERSGITNILTSRFAGRDVDLQGLEPLNIFSEEQIKELAKRTIHRMWGWFKGIGEFTSGLIGIYFLFRLCKSAAETFINAFHLHNESGWSIALLASFWDTLSVWIVDKQRQKQRSTTNANENLCTEVVATAPAPEEQATIRTIGTLANTRIYPHLQRTETTPPVVDVTPKTNPDNEFL